MKELKIFTVQFKKISPSFSGIDTFCVFVFSTGNIEEIRKKSLLIAAHLKIRPLKNYKITNIIGNGLEFSV